MKFGTRVFIRRGYEGNWRFIPAVLIRAKESQVLLRLEEDDSEGFYENPNWSVDGQSKWVPRGEALTELVVKIHEELDQMDFEFRRQQMPRRYPMEPRNPWEPYNPFYG